MCSADAPGNSPALPTAIQGGRYPRLGEGSRRKMQEISIWIETRKRFPLRQTLAVEYYDTPTLVFHWLTVVLVILLFGTSLAWNYLIPHDRFWRPLLEGTHVSVGILFAVLILARVICRLTGMRRLSADLGISGVLSRIMYVILYILLVANSRPARVRSKSVCRHRG